MSRKPKNRSKNSRKNIRSKLQPKTRKRSKPKTQLAVKRKRSRKTAAKSNATRKRKPKPRQLALARRKRSKIRPLKTLDSIVEVAVREMNRGQSLTAAARSHGTAPKTLKAYLRKHRISKSKGTRVTTRDNRLRRVPVMTNGKVRVLTVRGYAAARLVGEHHNAAGEFVRTNKITLIQPFEGQTVQAINGRKYPLETNPNALHRIAAMDTPPFHEIYEITSSR